MPRWRYATWLLVIWTVLVLIAIGVSEATRVRYEGWNAAAAYSGLGTAMLIVLAFIGWIVLGLLWLATRPMPQVVLYGPQGDQITVSEKEARRRVKLGGWTPQPPDPPSTDKALDGEDQA